MNDFRLLLVEDSETDRESCRDSVERYHDENQRKIILTESPTLEEALQMLDNSFDGAIIDLRLDDIEDGGNQIVDKIIQSNLRIPIAILTGTPDNAPHEFAHIGVFTKGEDDAAYINLFNKFWEVHDTGLTRIMGGRGLIEKTLGHVFLKNILPQKEKWIGYGSVDPQRTEKALLRHALNHLSLLLDEDDASYPEEFYIAPPLSETIATGSVVKKTGENSFFAVLNPACDLVIRATGVFKTDRLLLVEIEEEDQFVQNALDGITNQRKRRARLMEVFGNNFRGYCHWLPRTGFFPGGVLNFRHIQTVTSTSIQDLFDQPMLQISPSFVKDITARFSSYYARQGQPDIEQSEAILRYV